jgi:DNA mismatch repair protein MutS2
MEADRRSAEQNEIAARRSLEDAERLRKQYLDDHERLQRRKERETEDASRRAKEIVKKARDEAEAILRELRKQERENKTTEVARQRLDRLTGRVERRTRRREDVPQRMETSILAEPAPEGIPEPGEEVLLSQFGQRGVLLRRDDGTAEVQVGAMRMTVPTRSLQRVRSSEKPAKTPNQSGVGTISLNRALAMSSELDLRGQRADEALMNLEKHMDDARIAGMNTVRVIHGKGLGALRKIVWDAAKTDPTVRNVGEAPPEEGGAGVTVIEFK